MRHGLSLIIAILLLAGCTLTPAQSVPPLPDADKDTCGARQYQDLLGKPESVLERRLILKPVRIIRPGMAVTMDFLADRLNITLDETGTVTRLSCG